jgi:hypothetical protein
LTLDITLAYSATPDGSPSATFADKIGADATEVFSGPLTLSFDSILNFNTDFVYNPADGPLLVQIVNTSGGSTTQFDAGNSTEFSRVYDLSSPSASGTVQVGYGLATEFLTTSVTIREPSTWALMVIGFAGLGLAGWRTRRWSVAIAGRNAPS